MWGFLFFVFDGVRFCFSSASEGEGEESPFDFSIKLINVRIMLSSFSFTPSLLLMGVAGVMPSFRQVC